MRCLCAISGIPSFFTSGKTAALIGASGGCSPSTVRPRLALDLLLAVRVHEHRERRAVGADRRLDDVRHVALVLSAGRSTRASCPSTPGGGSRSKSAVVDALDLLEAERAAEVELDVERGARVVRELAPGVLVEAQPLLGRARASGCHSMRCAFQYSNHSMSVPGSTKNCISICSNSRVRKMKLPGVISLRNALPICAMPNGTFWRVDWLHVQEVDVDALRRLRAQVDHRRRLLDRPHERLEHEVELPRLRRARPSCRRPGTALRRPCASSSGLSARKRLLQFLQSTSGSAKPATWPLASQTRGCMRIAASSPSMSSRSRTIARHQRVLEVPLELDAERTVVPDGARAAVDLGRLEDEAAPLAQRHELLHHVGAVRHILSFPNCRAGPPPGRQPLKLPALRRSGNRFGARGWYTSCPAALRAERTRASPGRDG